MNIVSPKLGTTSDPNGGDAEKELQANIQTLEDIGVVSRINRMSLDEILNPDGELQNQWELWTADELFKSRQEESTLLDAEEIFEKNGPPPIERPTPKQALCQA